MAAILQTTFSHSFSLIQLYFNANVNTIFLKDLKNGRPALIQIMS